MPDLALGAPEELASVEIEQTTTTAFSASDDVDIKQDCVLKAIKVVLPSGETVDIVNEITLDGVGATDFPIRTGIASGLYAVGEDTPLKAGSKLKHTTNSVQSGTRAIVYEAAYPERG